MDRTTHFLGFGIPCYLFLSLPTAWQSSPGGPLLSRVALREISEKNITLVWFHFSCFDIPFAVSLSTIRRMLGFFLQTWNLVHFAFGGRSILFLEQGHYWPLHVITYFLCSFSEGLELVISAECTQAFNRLYAYCGGRVFSVRMPGDFCWRICIKVLVSIRVRMFWLDGSHSIHLRILFPLIRLWFCGLQVAIQRLGSPQSCCFLQLFFLFGKGFLLVEDYYTIRELRYLMTTFDAWGSSVGPDDYPRINNCGATYWWWGLNWGTFLVLLRDFPNSETGFVDGEEVYNMTLPLRCVKMAFSATWVGRGDASPGL